MAKWLVINLRRAVVLITLLIVIGGIMRWDWVPIIWLIVAIYFVALIRVIIMLTIPDLPKNWRLNMYGQIVVVIVVPIMFGLFYLNGMG
ncbi:hypothetical protein [Emcibacter nanhaiensis]|uniref:Uncharacterized protein n=1 Tax=Emcibacter nanhaiensis TaxID=1505037 RepID=A0A501PHH9_9PROT|nr:hypothetical protein [Emcibacter nanhaiensis]TPD59482.1 hypothetical protein FIV46_11880 [Emcibacter nanhaiensis]